MSADEIERIWVKARNRRGAFGDRQRPSKGISAVLVALLDGPRNGSETARRARQLQGNTAQWLNKLNERDFTKVVQEVESPSGGRPEIVWALTARGRELAELILAESPDLSPRPDPAPAGPSVGDVLRYTGATYRQLDYWVRQGLLTLDDPGPGSGTARSWPPGELVVARQMVTLINAGLTVDAAHRAVRNGGQLTAGVRVTLPTVLDPPPGVVDESEVAA